MKPETIVTDEGTAIVLRACHGFEEMEACVSLQIETWGYSDGDVIPAASSPSPSASAARSWAPSIPNPA